MRPNDKFRVELPKTNSGLAKSHFQQKRRGYVQKIALDTCQDLIILGSFDKIVSMKNGLWILLVGIGLLMLLMKIELFNIVSGNWAFNIANENWSFDIASENWALILSMRIDF